MAAKKKAKKAPRKTRTVRKQKSKRKPAPAPKDYENYHLPPLTEAQFVRAMSEDHKDAWLKLRAFAAGLGEQRIYTSAKAIMFAHRICYLFVRPQKSYLEVVFFLPEVLKSPLIRRGNRVSKTKAANTFKLVHADQVEEPLTDWIREAFEFTK